MDKMTEECGVFAVFSPNNLVNIGYLSYSGLFSLQHRGQESAGISFACGGKISTIKNMGLVNEVFAAHDLTTIQAHASIGHVRYSTTGSSTLANAQPLFAESVLGAISLAHNGNLINTQSLKQELESTGAIFQTTSDTEVILYLIAKHAHQGPIQAVITTCKLIIGAYALVMLINDQLLVMRDALGIRPLCYGIMPDNKTYIIASESCAIDVVGGTLIRDVSPGELLVFSAAGIQSLQHSSNVSSHPCSFEYIYFARPDSYLDKISVYSIRIAAGKALATQHPTLADIVVGVPDSGNVAAMGYAEASNIPYAVGLVRNKYMGRSFILPTQELREQAVKLKLNPLKEVVNGKSVILVDDSLVRGTTAKKLVKLLKDAGALAVHFRVASPMVISPCHYGVDISSKEELIASNMTTAQICAAIGADSIDFLSLSNQRLLLGDKTCCEGCFSGKYPLCHNKLSG